MRPRGRRPRRAAVLGVLLAGAATLGLSASPSREPALAPRLPAPLRPAFTVGEPRALSGGRHVAVWAPVRRRTEARVAPGSSAAVVTAVSPRTPEHTRNILAVIAHVQDASGAAWVRVRLAVLPNGTTGWVPRSALGGYGTVATQLVIDLRRRRATLFRAGRPVMRADVGVGAPGWPTPRGEFYIRDQLTRYRSAAYGPVAFGTSARSARATGWPAGGYVGIHGTDRPDLIPGRISHGCIRMRNADVLALAGRMPVGTPVSIR
jgi:lipoprotein-anchoring transpeptidase ErfK/SrfK